MNRAHPAPDELQARWRAQHIWTDETLLDRLDAVDGDTLAVVDGDTRLTVDDLRTRSTRLASALYERGVGPGDVVAWQLPNWWEAVVLCWAVWRCGATASPITPTLGAHELGFILRRTGARLMIVPQLFRGTDYPALVRASGYDGEVLVVRGDRPLPRGSAPLPAVVVSVDDSAVILWTSGTTSEPKGVVHTHQSLRVEADTIAAAHAVTAGEALLLPMPVTHVAGLAYGILLPVTSAITAVLMDTWEPGRALELLERESIAVIISTPVFMRTMIDHPAFADTNRASVRMFSLGGAGVAPAMVREGAHAFGCWCKRTYGSTEYPTLTTGRFGDDLERDATTDGPLIGAAELRIVDPKTLDDMPPGTPGELLARGPEMFIGYLDRSLDTDAFVDDGWFRTGDLAVYDGEYLTIVDRLKDIIIRGGENISAQEVEALLVTHPDITEAACVACPDPVMGETVCAYVIAVPGSEPSLVEVREHLLERGLARFKVPERLVLRETLPRTASGKVQKSPLRDELRAEADEARRG
ncbi:MAG: cyclohexanecarboxylate-CoA ligase [Actinomycetota bacterium]|nr:cyclohexanecarboxylate-CoA ligase [Actinomycetota bacterium]